VILVIFYLSIIHRLSGSCSRTYSGKTSQTPTTYSSNANWHAGTIFKYKMRRISKLPEGLSVPKAPTWKKLLRLLWNRLVRKIQIVPTKFWSLDSEVEVRGIRKALIKSSQKKNFIYVLVQKMSQFIIMHVCVWRNSFKTFILSINSSPRSMADANS
jgi:hypothetical protein